MTKPSLRKLFEELLLELVKRNYEERISAQQRRIELLEGNADEDRKRMRAMERYLKVDYKQETKYKKKKCSK